MKTKTAWPWVGLILAFLVLAAAIIHAGNKSQLTVHFSIQSSQPDRLQVFHDAEGHFSETNSLWVDTTAGETGLEIHGEDMLRLRLDPPTATVTTLCDLRLDRSSALAQFEVLHVSELSVTRNAGCVRFQPDSGARDPQFVLRFVGESASRIDQTGAWRWVLIAAWVLLLPLCALIGYLLVPRISELTRRIPVLPGFGRFQEWTHWVCAGLMLVFGVAYIVVTPPGAVADEEAHLAKIVRISQGVPFGASGAQLMPNPRAMYGSFSDYLENKQPFTLEQLETQLSRPLVCEPTTSQIPIGANGYSPHHYLLPTAAYVVGCATEASFGWFLYAARALNLLMATVLVAFGVACATRGKLGLFFIALLPMSMFQMSSISADALVLSVSIAWLGVISGIASGTLMPRRAAPALWGLSLAIALLKPGSAWILVALLFCKPAYDVAGESFRAAVVKFLVLPWAIHAGIALAASGSAHAAAWADSTVNLQALLHDPIAFLRVLAMTFVHNGERLGQTMVGVLGWLDVPLSWWTYWTASLLAVAAAWTNVESIPRLPRYVLPVALLAMAGSLVVIALPLFIYWTTPGEPIIQGLQGRYFTMTAAFALVWCSLRSPPGIRAMLAALLVVGLAAINIDAVYRLYEAYFVIGRR